MVAETVIRVEGLGKRYRIGRRERYKALRDVLAGAALAPWRWLRGATAGVEREEVWALRGVSFEVARGEVVGVIGRNGAGKTTLLKILSRLTEPTEGRGRVRGRVGSLLEVGTGFHPELTGRENVFLNGAILGMRRQEIRASFDDIVEFAEVQRFIDTPVKHYSSGMTVRLAFAVAAHLEPEILLVDEVLAVGDFAFQKKCLGKMGEVGRAGKTVLLVSHHMASILNLCQRVVLLEGGRVVQDGPAREVVDRYLARGETENSVQVWSTRESAPGTQRARVHSVKVLTPQGEASFDHDIENDILVAIRWWNLVEGARINAGLMVRDPHDGVVFGTNNLPSATKALDGVGNAPLSVGLYESVCRVPGALLNDATYRVDAYISRDLQAEIVLPSVVSFRVYDSGAMKKDIGGIAWIGTIRIRTEWTTRLVSTG